MMLTCHISHEKNFSTALYVPGRSGDKIILNPTKHHPPPSPPPHTLFTLLYL